MPAALADARPAVVESDDGTAGVGVRGRPHPQIGLNAVVGRPKDEWTMEPAHFDDMRQGCWDIHARIADMDVDGVWASLHFPSLIAGFCGHDLLPLLGPRARPGLRAGVERLAPRRVGRHLPRPVHPAPARRGSPIPRSPPPRCGATPQRGFRAVSFLEQPVDIGLPSMHTDHWDPFLRGLRGDRHRRVPALRLVGLVGVALARRAARAAAPRCSRSTRCVTSADWLWSGVPLRFPGLRHRLAEGGIDWVPMLIDRLDYVMDHSASGGGRRVGRRRSPRPRCCSGTSGSA